MPLLSPAELILERCRAFASGDYALVYDLHHPESFFRRLYPEREGYLEYARTVLRHDFRIRECRILKEQVTGEEARVIYYLDIFFKGERRESFELCRLRRRQGEWLYLETQKIERQDFPGSPEAIDWEDFERVKDKILF